jgi:lysophospholipase L1-like esterase
MAEWYEEEVRALERRAAQRPRRDDAVLFYGSSSFTLWDDMAERFPGYHVSNHGFGGSTLADCIACFDRLVTPVQPAAIILYAGDNDLDAGSTPERVLALLDHFIRLKRAALGALPMAFVSIKISPARFPIMHKIAYTNLIVERRLGDQKDVRFVDVTRRMVGAGIEPLLACFSHDPLHMNSRGYDIWTLTLTETLGELIPSDPR